MGIGSAIETNGSGIIYLLHFDKAFHHAKHYMGYTDNLEGRIQRHKDGNGAKLISVISSQGIGFQLARTWRGDRHFERKLKNRKKSWKLCPICKAENDGTDAQK